MKKKLLFLVIIFVVVFFYYQSEVSTPNHNDAGEKQFEIASGQGIGDIADNLEEQGFLDNKLMFKIYIQFNGYRSKFQEGKFTLKTDLSIKELVSDLIETRRTFEEQDIVLIEGWSIKEMDEHLTNTEIIEKGSLIDYFETVKNEDYEFLSDREHKDDLEGYVYPDTYRIYVGSSVEKIGEKMLANFDSKLTEEMRDVIKKQGKSIYDVITLASIVEKEMFGYENRRIVAGVFNNRLEIGMPLQSDATVNYITKKGIAAPSLDDIAIENPYNTYKNRGLPPGPICNPSIEAIKAVIYAEDTDYVYFLTTPDSEIIFSNTHDEHVQNKFKYLK